MNNPLTRIDLWGLASIGNVDDRVRHGLAANSSSIGSMRGSSDRGIGRSSEISYSARIGASSPNFSERSGWSTANSAACGIGHGIVDFAVQKYHSWQQGALFVFTGDWELDLRERDSLIQEAHLSQGSTKSLY